jgi:hypothetical protein
MYHITNEFHTHYDHTISIRNAVSGLRQDQNSYEQFQVHHALTNYTVCIMCLCCIIPRTIMYHITNEFHTHCDHTISIRNAVSGLRQDQNSYEQFQVHHALTNYTVCIMCLC